MGLQATDGPDGSSIKPVSSLLAKFENLNKPGDAPAQTGPPPPRAMSPAPAPAPATAPGSAKRDASPPVSRAPPAIPALRPKDKLNVSSLRPPSAPSSAPSSPTRTVPPPTGPRPGYPPALTVEPPHSPPKRGPGGVPTGDRPAFVSTDAAVKPASPAAVKQFKIPSRPHTPAPAPGEPRKSPRLVPSRPPSPPPPRRSGEIRRESVVVKDGKVVPPPVNRAEKPLIPSRASYMGESLQVVEIRGRSNDKMSPFNSPPSSAGTPEDDDIPPILPARPRPQPSQAESIPPIGRAKTFQIGFEPPPVHHTLVSRRQEREGVNGLRRDPLTPQITGETRPALPARPQSVIEPPRPSSLAALPPRPPRPGAETKPQEVSLFAAPAMHQKRVISTPTTQSPPKTLVRSNTVVVAERVATSRIPNEARAIAAPRPPMDTRPPLDAQLAATSRTDPRVEAPPSVTTAYPDTSKTNRSRPFLSKGVHQISTKYDARVFDVCGELACTTGAFTRVWSVLDGELLMSLSMGEGMKGTSVIFKPGANVDEEGRRVWVGTNNGEVLEAEVASQTLVASRPSAHGRHEVIKIYRHFNEVWTLDESGTLHVWGPDENGTPTLNYGPTQSYRVPKGHMFSMVVGDELWHATGKEIRVFLPTTDGRQPFQVLIRPLCQDSAGEVTSGTLVVSEPDKVYFGHIDGKVSVYSRTDYSCLALLNVSQYKINSLVGVGRYMWAGYNTGKISVYDMETTPWTVKKDWQAHDNPVVKLIADHSSFYKLDRYQVVSLGADNMLRTWDGLLQEDWLEAEMKRKDAEYCSFDKIKGLILTWNAGASTPNSLRYSESDARFIQDLLQSSDSPDILVFGFQELVDLEDKTATAKRFLKPKKKEGSDQERMSHQYRDWRDFLVRSLDDYMSGDLYHLLHTAPLVGLFTCIFVKADLRDRISNLSSAEVKRGMGGLHGNKGAIVVRFMVDDTSMCFINCHLAAGQSGANQRHNDIAAILEASLLPAERDSQRRIDSFVGGGDGTMILDHELCLLNGDLNYRIDTMSRDTVVTAVKAGNLAKLLERDQLLVARRRNPGFRLRAFEEMPIRFAPTYKYDVGTDNYDTSEKKRSPAWCDRLLFRSGGRGGRIEQLDYRRHEVRVSDHRPVSGRFRFVVKRVSVKRRAVAWMEAQTRWEDIRARDGQGEKMFYLTQIIGYDEATAQRLVNERAARARRDHRSPSRHREDY